MDTQLTPQKVQQQFEEILNDAEKIADSLRQTSLSEVEVTDEEKENIIQRVDEEFRGQLIDDDFKRLKIQDESFKERLALIEKYNALIRQVFEHAWSKTFERFFTCIEQNVPESSTKTRFMGKKEKFKDFIFQINTSFSGIFDLSYGISEYGLPYTWFSCDVYDKWLDDVIEKLPNPKNGKEIPLKDVKMWDWIAQWYFGKKKMICVPQELSSILYCSDFVFEGAFDITSFRSKSPRGMHWETSGMGKYARPFREFQSPEMMIEQRKPRRKLMRCYAESSLEDSNAAMKQLWTDECDSRM